MAEIRLRDLKPDFIKKVEAIQKDLKEKTATGAIEKLVNSYASTQQWQKQLSNRNSELHKKLTYYYSLEGRMKQQIEQYLRDLNIQIRNVKPLLKGLAKRAGTKSNRPKR